MTRVILTVSSPGSGWGLPHGTPRFPRKQVFVLRYRDLVDVPTQALDAICAFLGVAPGIISQVPRENVTAHPEHSSSHRAVSGVLRSAAAAGRATCPAPRVPLSHSRWNGSYSAVRGRASR